MREKDRLRQREREGEGDVYLSIYLLAKKTGFSEIYVP